jgi:diguanylate cyclase (GGDEF)-like protein
MVSGERQRCDGGRGVSVEAARLRERITPRWMTVPLGALLAGLLCFAVVGSWRQEDIVGRIAVNDDNTDAYQHAAYLSAWEMAQIQASLRDPHGEQRVQLPATILETQAAMSRMAAVDTVHRDRSRGIADQHRQLEPMIDEYLRLLDDGDETGARALLETNIEPAAEALINAVLQEQDEHLAVNNTDQAAARRESRTLVWGSALTFGIGLLVIVLFGIAARANRRRVETMAATDALTGLPNRTAFTTRAEAVLAQESGERRTRGGGATVLAVNLDGFRDVNDQLGHQVGDVLLTQVGQRLLDSVRDQDYVARLGGDEFAVLLREADPAIGEAVASRLTESFDKPFLVGDVTIDLEVSIGASTADADEDVTTLLQHADIALHTAKQQRLGFRRFTADNTHDTAARLTLLGDLRRALEHADEMILHYQPKVAMGTGTLAGVEALARWRHPEKGWIAPGDFIPVLETTHLIHRFTDHVLELAVTQARVWLDAGHRLPVAVNISTRSLLDTSFPDRVAAVLERIGLPGELLCIEVTEGTVMTDPGTAITALRRIRDLGVKTSIDDYGTGYSSMTYLRLLPLDELKVDRSFVQDMILDHGNHALVTSTVELGHNLGLTVVAEGVEDAETLAALREVGCDLAQGYHLARPMPAEDIAPMLTRAATPQPA